MNVLIDVIVPTYNRYDVLPEFFKNNEALNRPDIFVWIIDDCSEHVDRTVLPHWPNLIFISLPENKGQAHARNVAIEKGVAPFVISLDDDAWFEAGELALARIPELFRLHTDAGCFMFNIATPDSPYTLEANDKLLPMHVTCGCVYRREVLNAIGGFPGFFHSGGEEMDVSLHLYQAGFSIRFAPEIRVFHNFAPHQRPVSWYYNVRYHTTRNDLLIVVMYYPIGLVLPFLGGKYLSHFWFAVKNRVSVPATLWFTVKALGGFFRLLPAALQRRRPLTMEKFKFWRSLLYK